MLISDKVRKTHDMKKIYAIAALIVAGALFTTYSWACSNVIVTKGASADGSVMVTYSADSHQLYGELYFHPAGNFKEGDMFKVYGWDEGRYMGYIPQIPQTIQTVGNMNARQVTITETTFGGRAELEGGSGIMEYGALIYTTLQRASSAREAIQIMDELCQTYGYVSPGESFSVADPNEAWIMEIVSKGDGTGAVWVARRVPDGYICSHANQARISTFPLNDPENCLYSKDVITFAREKGYFDGPDEEFSFCDAYCPIDFSGARACEARVWAAYNILGEGTFVWEDEEGEHSAPASDWLDFAMGHNLGHKMPLFIKPAKKVELSALADVMRDHFEDTPMDMTQDVGAGNNACPYRWRPMDFELDGQTYVHERALATQQTGFWILCQSRGWLPDELGGILWFGVDDAATSALTPVYTNILASPEPFREGNGSMTEYSATSAFWQVNKVAHFAYLFYDRVAPVVTKEIKDFEAVCFEKVAETDEQALRLVEKGKVKKAKKLMTETTECLADDMMARWHRLENALLVKYLDGNVKVQDENGEYVKLHPDTDIPASPEHPAQREHWLRAIVRDHGDVLMVK